MKRILTLLSALVCFSSAALAQNATCGFEQAHANQLLLDPSYAQAVALNKAEWVQYQQLMQNALVINTPNGPQYEIPVVVHVIHLGGAVGTSLNPSDATIQGMINYLTQSYRAAYTPYPDSNNGGVAFPVSFVLAKRDSNCAATTGIVRVNGSSLPGYAANGINLTNTNGASELSVKNLSRWPRDRYYNIWIVTEIDGNNGGAGTVGYAYYPGGSALLDGTVMQASTVGTPSPTLTHEVGHAFNLAHTFEGDANGTACPPNANCATDGDDICDTEPHIRSFGCPTGPNSCNGNQPTGNVRFNHMNYTNCRNRFTAGQRTRWMFAALNSRTTLMASLGSVAPGGGPAAACIPTITNAATTANAGPRRVILNTLNIPSSGYNGDGDKVHYDRTCEYATEIFAGQSYTMTVQTGTGGHQVKAYIDYNNNGSFADPGEQVFTSTGTASFQNHTGTVAVPTTNVTYCAQLRMRVVADLTTAATVTACGPLTSGQAEDYTVIVRPAPAPVNVAITSGGNPSCANTPLTFTATPGVGFTATGYSWQVNGAAVGATGSTYTSSTLVNGDVVRVKMFYISACGADSSLSTGITVVRSATVPPTVTVAITAGSNPGCAGDPITFTATGTNTGTNPVYQWLVNGVPVSSALGPVFTTSTLVAGNVVTAYLLSNSPCASPSSATSAPITIQLGSVTPTVTITQTAGTVPLCAGKPATFTANPSSGGTTPAYTWFVNGNGVPGVTGPSFTTTSLQNGDTIRVLLTSSSSCANPATVLSAGLGVAVLPTDTPTLSVVLTAGANPGCKDSLLAWTATVTKLGSLPTISWIVNGVTVATGPTFSSTTLQTGNTLIVRATAGTSGCRTTDTLFSAPIFLVRDTTPAAPLISYIGNNLVSNLIPVQWYGPAGLIPGATSGSYTPTAPGWYYARATNGACGSLPSNRLQVSLLDIADRNMQGVRVFPNPTKGSITMDWGSTPTTAELFVCNGVGQVLVRASVQAAASKTLDLGNLAPGVYYIVVKDATGKVGAMPVTVLR